MDLVSLGFDAWFESHLDLARPGRHPARIVAADKDRYLLRDEHGERPAEPTGRLLFAAATPLDLPTVGDWVCAEDFDDRTFAVIHAVLPRRSLLKRKTSGRTVDFHLLAANVDVAFVVQSIDQNFNLKRLDRYFVMIRDGGIHPVLLLSKTDLEPGILESRIESVRGVDGDVRILPFSNLDGRGLEDVQSVIEPGKTYCLLGSSGVGKTSLLNRLIGEDAFTVADVRGGDGKGRHTTTRRQLVVLPSGGMIVDTPGLRELGTIGMEEGIARTFPEFEEYLDHCRFKDCTHIHEAGCAVREALDRGELARERYESYLKLKRESAYHASTYLERRRRDRAFGKFCKSVMKHKRNG